MKRAILVANQWSRNGGLEIVTQDEAQALCDLGYNVTVIPASGLPEESGFVSRESHGVRGVSAFHLASRDANKTGGSVYVKWITPRNRLLQSLWHRFLKYRLLARLINRTLNGEPALIVLGHVQLLRLFDYFHLAAKCKIWVWTHGDEVWGEYAEKYAPLLNKCDQVISVSDDTKKHLLRGGVTAPVTTIHNSIDIERFIPTKTPEKIRRDEILICSRIPENFEYKGHARLMEAMVMAEELLGHKLRMRVVGGGPGLPRLRRLVADKGLDDRILVTGRVTDEELIEAYQHCGLFCMPSDNEGFGLVYAEAEACARPVVVSTIGGAPETIVDGETGVLADPFNIEANARAIAKIVGNPAMADEMGRKGRMFVERQFSFDAFRRHVAACL